MTLIRLIATRRLTFLAFILLVPIISTIYSNSFEINEVNCSALGSYLKEDTIYFNNPENLGGEVRWGNWLSPYFHAIGLAILGNLNFVNKEGFLQDEPFVFGKVPLLVGHRETRTWLKYLPRKLDRNSDLPIGKSASFVDACGSCSIDSSRSMYHYPHEKCLSPFYITDFIANMTQTAMKRWVDEGGKNDEGENEVIPNFENDDVTIFLRCASSSLNIASNSGPSGFKVYLNAPKTTKRFYLVYDHKIFTKESFGVYFCSPFFGWLKEFLKQNFPNAAIIDEEGSLFSDYSKIVFSKFVFVETGTFGLYSSLASSGQVYMPPIVQRNLRPHSLCVLFNNCETGDTLIGPYYPNQLPERFHVVANALFPTVIEEKGWAKRNKGMPPNFDFLLIKQWLLEN